MFFAIATNIHKFYECQTKLIFLTISVLKRMTAILVGTPRRIFHETSAEKKHRAVRDESHRMSLNVHVCAMLVPFQANSPSKDGEQKSVTSRVKCFPTQRPWLAHLHYKVCGVSFVIRISWSTHSTLCAYCFMTFMRQVYQLYRPKKMRASSPQRGKKGEWISERARAHSWAACNTFQTCYAPQRYLYFVEWEKRNKCSALWEIREDFMRIKSSFETYVGFWPPAGGFKVIRLFLEHVA